MKISEIYAMEESNKSSIILHLEGMFYKAYEKSAFRFCRKINDFKVSFIHSASLSCDIVRVGFPKSALEKYSLLAQKQGYTVESENANLVVIKGIEPIEGYTNWKRGCVEACWNRAVSENASSKLKSAVSDCQKLRLYREAYDNAVALTNFTSKLHRNYRFGMGDALRNESLSLAVKLHVALKRNSPIDEENVFYEIEQMRIRTRIMHDVKQFDVGVWKMLNDRFDKMQQMLRSESCNPK